MARQNRPLGAPELLILVGGCVFIVVLYLSAYFEADIRWLHFFQAWMYIATMWLALCRSRWGYFIGISAAGLWNYTNLFVTGFFPSGLRWLAEWMRAGQLTHADQIIAVPAWAANLMVVVGSAWAYTVMPAKRRSDVGRMMIAFILTTGFFAAAIAIFQPRYLPLFHGILYPHRPW